MNTNSIQEKDVLTQILGFTRTKSKQAVANKLLSEFGSLKQVLDADVSELSYIA